MRGYPNMQGIEYLIFAVLCVLTGVLFLRLPIDSPQRPLRAGGALAQFKQLRGLIVAVCFSMAALLLALWTGFI